MKTISDIFNLPADSMTLEHIDVMVEHWRNQREPFAVAAPKKKKAAPRKRKPKIVTPEIEGLTLKL